MSIHSGKGARAPSPGSAVAFAVSSGINPEMVVLQAVAAV
jgi:hypothetical protein